MTMASRIIFKEKSPNLNFITTINRQAFKVDGSPLSLPITPLYPQSEENKLQNVSFSISLYKCILREHFIRGDRTLSDAALVITK